MCTIWKVGGQGEVGGEETLLEATWKGEYDPIVAYLLHDTVSYLGSAYICIFPCTGIAPTDASHWEIVVEKGDEGDTGANSTVAGPAGSTGPQGPQGIQGGTGSQGIQGGIGLTGAASTVPGPQGEIGSTGPQGPQGVQGTAGATGSAGASGSNGTNGKTVWNGASDPTTGNPTGVQAGDFYVNTTTHVIFGPYTTSWPAGISLVGSTGATGSVGATGSQGIQGIQGTTGAAGAKGDTGSTGAKGDTGSTGAAGSNGTNGTNGTNGKTLWSGAGTPTTGLPSGVQTGDFYINTAANTIYGPYSAGWGSPTSLVGATGAAGSNGTNGTNGAAGATGATGPGVATGGSAAQVLAKIDATNFNTHWVDPAAGGGDTTGLQTQLNGVRPFAAPVTTQTVAVPLTIEHTGATEVSAALNTFIESVPDGSIISFPTGATYKLHQGIQFANRHNLIFEGNGTTLQVDATAAANDSLSSPFYVGYLYTHDVYGGNTDIVIHDFILVGNDPTPGTFTEGSESAAGIKIYDADRVEVYDITSSATNGDFLNVYEASKGVWVHDCHVLTAGRNGIAVISGSDILVEDCAFDVSGWITFDVEANVVGEASSNVTFRNNTAGTWVYAFFTVYDIHEAAIDQITVDNNTVTGGSLNTLVVDGGTVRMTRITFTNNKGTVAAGPVLAFSYVDGLTVTGNVQPLSSGALMSITSCTQMVLEGITAAGLALMDDANAAAQLATLGLTATAVELNQLDGKTLTGNNSGDQNAAGVSIADAGGIITGTNVEAALQENRTAINLNTAKVGVATGVVTLASMANMATASLIYRKTASAGVPEVNTLSLIHISE